MDFVHGSPLMVEVPNGTARTAGDVVVIGELNLVHHVDFTATETQHAAYGGGVYDAIADGALTAGARVYYDAGNDKVSATDGTGTHKHFGYVAPSSSASGDGDTVRVVHSPEAP